MGLGRGFWGFWGFYGGDFRLIDGRRMRGTVGDFFILFGDFF